jgi:hypothetical protein
MATRYTYATTLDLGDGEEHEVEVSFSVAWGSPEIGRGYMADPYGYDPGSPDLVEDVHLALVDSMPNPLDQEGTAMVLQKLTQNHEEAMLEEASQREAAWQP